MTQFEKEVYACLDTLIKFRAVAPDPDQPIRRTQLCDFMRTLRRLAKVPPANFDDIAPVMQNWANDRGYVFEFNGFDDQNRMLNTRILSKKT